MRLRGSRCLASFLMIATLASDAARKPWDPADRDSNVASIRGIELTRPAPAVLTTCPIPGQSRCRTVIQGPELSM
jgi:hypothetical protein